jgi:hypothetical protein
MSQLEDLIKETRAAFIIAKSDGVLDSSEVIEIAVDLAQKVSKLASLSGTEKKSLLLHTLKKGLDDSGGFDSLVAFTSASDDMKRVFQEQILAAASAAVDLVLSAASGKLDLRKPASWLPSCFNVVKALLPKDQKLINDALKFSDKYINKDVETTEVTVVEEPKKEEQAKEEPKKVEQKKVEQKKEEPKKVEKKEDAKKAAAESVVMRD